MVEAAGAVVAARGPSRGRRVVVAIVLAVIALAVVGMHQLSLGHLFITADDRSGSTVMHGSMAMRTGPDDRVTAPSTGSTSATPAVDLAGADSCPGCGDHLMGAATCLLSLTSLVLFWWLRLPRPRPLPPGLPRTAAGDRPLQRPVRVRALSPTELSVLRT